ncbi:MAG: protein kinase, partial [Micrococcales bacterium]|nr:protein kinase [Micrococcales bacterium]
VPVPWALAVTCGVLTALEFAHRAGIVHRDIKPGNIMITSEGVVKVMDFGIARAVDDDWTSTQTVVGTPGYLSPEHAAGKVVDVRSDLYSTGCVLFELLTGRPPFVSESAFAVAVQHIQEPPPVPSTLNPALPAALDQIVAKALVKDREVRYQTAVQFRADLEAVDVRALANDVHATDEIVMSTTAKMPVAPVVVTAVFPPAPVPHPGPDRSAGPAPVAAPPAPRDWSSPGRDPGLVAGPAPAPGWAATPVPGPPAGGRRRWPWVAGAAAAAAAALVVGAVVLAMRSDDATATSGDPVYVPSFDPSTVDQPSADQRERSVRALDPDASITVLTPDESVDVVDLAGTVTPWTEP